MIKKQYTEKQLKIISGEIPLETIDGREATWLYKKAIENGDMELADRALQRKEQAKDEARKKNIERTIQNKALRRKGIYQWKQPKSNEYTEHQKQIIRGEIPFEEVHSNELISIYQKAINNKNFGLAESILGQIDYRRKVSDQKEKLHKKHKKKIGKIIDGFDDYDLGSPIPEMGQAILNGMVNIFECPKEEIIKLIAQLEDIEDEENLKLAKQLLMYKQDVSILYPVKNHWEAVDRLEELLQLPIRRPKDWLVKN